MTPGAGIGCWHGHREISRTAFAAAGLLRTKLVLEVSREATGRREVHISAFAHRST
jgi:hypothetical protein